MPRGTAISSSNTREIAPMMKDTQMTSLNFWMTGTVYFQLSPKLPVTRFFSCTKKPGISSRSNPYWAFSWASHSS